MPDAERKLLEQLRCDLDEFADEMHRVRAPLGISLYEAHARIAKYERVAGVQEPLPTSLSSDEAAFEKQLSEAVRLGENPHRISAKAEGAGSIWQGAFAPETLTLPDLQARAERALDAALAALLRLQNETECFAALCPEPLGIQTLPEARRFAGLLRPLCGASAPALRLLRQSLTGGGNDDAFQETFQSDAARLGEAARRLESERETLLGFFKPSALECLPSYFADLRHGLSGENAGALRSLLGQNGRETAAQHGEVFIKSLEVLQNSCAELHEISLYLGRACGVPSAKLPDVTKMGGSLPALAQIALQAARFSPSQAGWLQQDALASRKKWLNEVQTHQNVLQKRAELLSAYQEEIFALDAAGLRRTLGTGSAQSHWLLSTPAALKVRRALQAVLLPGVLLKERDLGEDLEQAAQVSDSEKWFAHNASALSEAFGPFYNGLQTDWDALRSQIMAVENLRVAVIRAGFTNGGPNIPLQLVAQIADGSGVLPTALRQKGEQAASLMSAAGDAWKQIGMLVVPLGGTLPSPHTPFADLAAWSEAQCAVIAGYHGPLQNALGLRCESAAGEALSVDILCDHLETAQAFGKAKQAHETDTAEFWETHQTEPCRTAADWQALQAAWEESRVLQANLNQTDLVEIASLLDLLEDDETRPVLQNAHQALCESLGEAGEAWAGLDIFTPSYRTENGLDLNDSFGNVRAGLQTRRDAASLLDQTRAALRFRADCNAAQLGGFFARFDKVETLTEETLSDAFRAAFFRGWVQAVACDTPALSGWASEAHEKKMERFCALDRKLHEAAGAKIKQATKGRVNKTELRDEISVLNGQLARRRTGQVRGLLAQMPHLLLALKPCVMMNPLSVRQYLDPDAISFDVVLFDDASQIATEEAVGAILRGKQIIIAGDLKQLPPLPLMESEENAQNDEKESILDAVTRLAQSGTAGFGSHTLNWHYRSMNESLISYSRRHFYPDLISFPAASTAGAVQTLSLSPDADEAQYAARIVDEMMAYAEREPSHSIGIITLDEAAQQALLTEIAHRKTGGDAEDAVPPSLPESSETDAEIETEEAFFVKTIENVQGEERDMIILCVPPQPERWSVLNKRGGDRQLNVAATRARRAMIVASGVCADAVPAGETEAGDAEANAAVVLKPFLQAVEEAATRQTNKQGDEPEAQTEENVVEAHIADALTQRGWIVHRRVGLGAYRVDLAVVDKNAPEQYLLGITCDGPSYVSGKTARLRDRQRPQMLGERGWNLVRVWSAAWNEDANQSLAAIEAALATAQTKT